MIKAMIFMLASLLILGTLFIITYDKRINDDLHRFMQFEHDQSIIRIRASM